jgi:hypothetical protein
MYQTFLAASMLTVSSEKAGVVGLAVKNGVGSAAAEASGSYIGSEDLVYTVKIDSVASGAEIGQATFAWKDGTGDWNATGVPTSTSPTALNNGVSIKFIAGSGDDFALGDKWTFVCRKPFGRGKLLDGNPNSDFRSAGLDSPVWLKADLGSARQVRAFVLLHHNITSGATITLQANSADDWGAPPYSQAITWAAGVLCFFLNETYRWWRLTVTDASNPDGYIRASELYLGDYLEFQDLAPVLVAEEDNVMQELSSRSQAGVERVQLFSQWREWRLQIANKLSSELTSLNTLFEGVRDIACQRTLPCLFTPDSSVASETYLVFLDGTLSRKRVHTGSLLGSFGCRELVRVSL